MLYQVFVGGLRESEDAVHITEEELATYFSKFGVIESVSINRDDRTHRGRGFAFVKFFQEVSLSAVGLVCSSPVLYEFELRAMHQGGATARVAAMGQWSKCKVEQCTRQ